MWGCVLGCAIAGADILMAAVSRDLLTFCFNFLVSCALYSLGGYIAGSLTGRRRQGMAAGLVAAVLVAAAGTLALQLVPQWRVEGWGLLGAAVFNLGFNAPLGAVFGYLGGSIGAKQE